MRRMITVGLLTLCACSAVLAQEQTIENTQEITTPLVSPDQAARLIELPSDFEVTVFAAEPEIRQPISITTDARGRIWMAECLTYAESQKNFDTQYDDRVIIFEDTDQDGVADLRKVFWEGGKKLSSVEVGMGGVWVTCAPNLLFIPDANGDDIPDGPAEIMLDGFNDDFVRHNLVNGLKFGPDGWLYGRHGIQATSHVGAPGSSDSQRTSLNCCIWKFHPVTHEFQVVCEGTTNPWGHDWDQHGELFMINTVIGHLWHVVPGARYRRMYGSHFNPYTYEPIEQTADHFHFSGKENWSDVNRHGISDETSQLGGGHAHCGLMIYQGDNWPKEYRNDAFTANFHGLRLNRESLERQGNGYVAHHEKDFMQTTDAWFRGVELIYGPDGGVYLLDWSDIGECHENDGVHRTTGRVFKIAYRPKGSSPTQGDNTDHDLTKLTNQQLLGLLGHENRWFPRAVRKELQRRALNAESRETINQLLDLQFDKLTDTKTALSEERTNLVLQTMWTQQTINSGHASSRLPDSLLFESDEHIRAWAIRLGLGNFSQRLELAKADPSGLVRLYLASSLDKLAPAERLQLAEALCGHEQDNADRTQAKLIWYQLEPIVVDHANEAIAIARASKLSHVRRCIVRRLAADVDARPELLSQLLDSAVSSNHCQEFLEAILESLSGRISVTAPENWQSVSNELMKRNDNQLDDTLAFLGTIFGEGVSIQQLRMIVGDKNKDPLVRRQAIQTIGESKPDDLFDFLKSHIWDRSVALQVVRSMENCANDQVADTILNTFGTFDLATERAAINTLCTRKPWAAKLLQAIETGRVSKNRVLASHARQIKNLADAKLTESLNKTWGRVTDTSADKIAMIEHIRSIVDRKNVTPDFANGAKLFAANCASCHVLYGEGGQRGPDLTGSDRRNLSYLLENVIDPSASVADTYRSSILLMQDGRTLIGVTSEETETTLKLLMVESEVVLEKAQIENRRDTTKSLMPDGLLDQLSEQEVTDLFGFLGK